MFILPLLLFAHEDRTGERAPLFSFPSLIADTAGGVLFNDIFNTVPFASWLLFPFLIVPFCQILLSIFCFLVFHRLMVTADPGLIGWHQVKPLSEPASSSRSTCERETKAKPTI